MKKSIIPSTEEDDSNLYCAKEMVTSIEWGELPMPKLPNIKEIKRITKALLQNQPNDPYYIPNSLRT